MNDINVSLSQQDYDITGQMLALLSAGYQGSLVCSTVLLQVKHPSEPVKIKEFAQRMLLKIKTWFDDFMEENRVLVSNQLTRDEVPHMELAWQLLDNLRLEFREVVEVADMLMAANPSLLTQAEVGWFLAQRVRLAYTVRDRLLVHVVYAQVHNDARALGALRDALYDVGAEIALVDGFVDEVLAKGFTPEIRAELAGSRGKVARFARLFECDLIALSNSYKEKIPYSAFGISDSEAKVYDEKGVPARMAGRWLAAGFFDSKEMFRWLDAGWREPEIAVIWLESRIDPETAFAWYSAQVGPDIAKAWLDAGFDLQGAKVYIDKGMKVPPK